MCSFNIDVNNVCWSWFTDSKITQHLSNEWIVFVAFIAAHKISLTSGPLYCWTCVRLPEWTVNLPLNLLCLSEFQSDIYSTGSVIRPTSNKPMTGKEWRHPSHNMTCNTDVISPASCWSVVFMVYWLVYCNCLFITYIATNIYFCPAVLNSCIFCWNKACCSCKGLWNYNGLIISAQNISQSHGRMVGFLKM